MGSIILITIAVSEICDHCQNLLDDPRITWGPAKSLLVLETFQRSDSINTIPTKGGSYETAPVHILAITPTATK